ncbi:hypothetical protein F6V25_08045 [Oryzomonas japonica]|uniref:Uncharacterized protein n=1 Tax=Oryzomonas japonica TaxID=2603858 RepID=A0A7J4ZR51_9BACT|nr:hypothetical protein [Oryzomonas japonica]KAB0665664.1 hypothetical protein F6V25_08045 [Oryzomonas japonica]
MKHFLLVALFITMLAGYADAAIQVISKEGIYTSKPDLATAAKSKDGAGQTFIVTSALSAVQSNISSATLHGWPADRSLRVEKGGSINNTTSFVTFGHVNMNGGTFGGTGRVTINGSFESGQYDVFPGGGLVTFGPKAAKYINPLIFGADPTGATSSRAAFVKSIGVALRLAPQLTAIGGGAPFVTIKLPGGRYSIPEPDGVVVQNPGGFLFNLAVESDEGANIVGNAASNATGTNKGFDFQGSAFKNIFRKLVFSGFGTAIKFDSSNRDQSFLSIENCESNFNDTFLDTVSFENSRSTIVTIEKTDAWSTRVFVKSYTDGMTISNSWIYAGINGVTSPDALLYLSGEGLVKLENSFFIPNIGENSSSARWIDFVNDTAQSTGGNRSLHNVIVTGSRVGAEGSRAFIWTYDNSSFPLSGGANTSSVVVQDSFLGGVGGYPVVTYKTGYPGSVNLRNCQAVRSSKIVAVDPANTTYPKPTVPSTGPVGHVIMIDEATRLSQANSNNTASLIDPLLEPFTYDTTSQTSKYKRSITKNIDYRLAAVNAPGAGTNKVKVTIPIFFDSASTTVPNRDILTFLLVTVGDGLGYATAHPEYRSTSVSLVSMIGGFNGATSEKKIIVTPIQDAMGGVSYGSSATPTVFFGTGDTGSAVISPTSTTGTEKNMTFVWTSSDPPASWAYIVPISGIRENQQDKAQYTVW